MDPNKQAGKPKKPKQLHEKIGLSANCIKGFDAAPQLSGGFINTERWLGVDKRAIDAHLGRRQPGLRSLQWFQTKSHDFYRSDRACAGVNITTKLVKTKLIAVTLYAVITEALIKVFYTCGGELWIGDLRKEKDGFTRRGDIYVIPMSMEVDGKRFDFTSLKIWSTGGVATVTLHYGDSLKSKKRPALPDLAPPLQPDPLDAEAALHHLTAKRHKAGAATEEQPGSEISDAEGNEDGGAAAASDHDSEDSLQPFNVELLPGDTGSVVSTTTATTTTADVADDSIATEAAHLREGIVYIHDHLTKMPSEELAAVGGSDEFCPAASSVDMSALHSLYRMVQACPYPNRMTRLFDRLVWAFRAGPYTRDVEGFEREFAEYMQPTKDEEETDRKSVV